MTSDPVGSGGVSAAPVASADQSVDILESNQAAPGRAAPSDVPPASVSSVDEQRAASDPVVQRFRDAVEGRLVTIKPAPRDAGSGGAEATPEGSAESSKNTLE